MKQAFKMGAVAIILACGTVQVRSDQTNLIQTLDLQLFGMEQGDTVTDGNFAMAMPVTETVGTSQVIAALGAATGKSFSRAAEITVTTLLPDGPPSFTVSDGGALTDVSGFFTYQQLGDSVENWLLNLKTGKAFWTTYSIGQLTLQDCLGYAPLKLHFALTGMAVESLPGPSPLRPGDGLTATGVGLGDLNGNSMILQGTFAFRGYTLVVLPGGGAGD
jgi:hypothetical protein